MKGKKRRVSTAEALERIAFEMHEGNKTSKFEKQMEKMNLEAAQLQIQLLRDELTLRPKDRVNRTHAEVYGRAYK